MIQGRRVTRGSSWLALSHWDRWGREGRTLTTGSFFSYFISVVVAFTFTLHSGVLFPNSKQDERRRRQRSASFPDGRRASHSPPNDFFCFCFIFRALFGPACRWREYQSTNLEATLSIVWVYCFPSICNVLGWSCNRKREEYISI